MFLQIIAQLAGHEDPANEIDPWIDRDRDRVFYDASREQ
jgi:hypothetical protein